MPASWRNYLQHPVTTNICRPVPVHPSAIKSRCAETDVLSSISRANAVQDKIFMTIHFKQAGNIVFLSAFLLNKALTIIQQSHSLTAFIYTEPDPSGLETIRELISKYFSRLYIILGIKSSIYHYL